MWLSQIINPESCSESGARMLLAKLRSIAVNEWAKIVVTILCSVVGSALTASILVWNLLKDHEAKLMILDVKFSEIEKAFISHDTWHKTQYDLIASKLTEIQVDIGRIQGARDGR